MKKRSTFGWMELLLGIVFIIIGIYTFANPSTALGGFVVAYGILAIVSGFADIVFYVRLERRTGFGPITSLVAGILNILLGIMLVMNIRIGALAITIFFPIWFIAHCVGRLTNLGFVRSFGGNTQYWISLIVNVLGLILGFLLLFNPFASAVSMTYLVGFYLILLGAGSIVTGFSKLGQ